MLGLMASAPLDPSRRLTSLTGPDAAVVAPNFSMMAFCGPARVAVVVATQVATANTHPTYPGKRNANDAVAARERLVIGS
jgi:hypothetical protein